MAPVSDRIWGVLIGVGGIESPKQGTPTGLGIVAPLANAP
jgi:hypothetical protein